VAGAPSLRGRRDRDAGQQGEFARAYPSQTAYPDVGCEEHGNNSFPGGKVTTFTAIVAPLVVTCQCD